MTTIIMVGLSNFGRFWATWKIVTKSAHMLFLHGPLQLSSHHHCHHHCHGHCTLYHCYHHCLHHLCDHHQQQHQYHCQHHQLHHNSWARQRNQNTDWIVLQEPALQFYCIFLKLLWQKLRQTSEESICRQFLVHLPCKWLMKSTVHVLNYSNVSIKNTLFICIEELACMYVCVCVCVCVCMLDHFYTLSIIHN